MNLHQIVRGAINAVNPDQDVIIKVNKGNQHFPGGIVKPIWEEVNAKAQVQPVSSYEIQFIDNYVSSSVYKNFYLFGAFPGLSRRSETGGDIIRWNGFDWFIDSVPEEWNTVGWTKVRGVQQLPGDDNDED